MALAPIALALAGCGDDNLPRLSFADNLRILAVKSSVKAARANTGPTIFTALVADPKGNGRNITYNWAACLPSQLDATGTVCTQTITTSTATSTSLSPTFNFTNNFSAAGAVVVTLSASAGSEFRAATRTLAILDASVLVDIPSPTLGELRINGVGGTGTVSLFAGNTYNLELTVSSGQSPSGFVTWITEGGGLQADRTLSFTNVLSPPNAPGSYRIHAIYNDGSGGVDFLTRTFNVP
jgi:hypothetical protein